MSKDICASGQEEVIFSAWLFRDLGSFALWLWHFVRPWHSKQKYGWFCGQVFFSPRAQIWSDTISLPVSSHNSVIWPLLTTKEDGKCSPAVCPGGKENSVWWIQDHLCYIIVMPFQGSSEALPGRHGFRSWLCLLLSWWNHLFLCANLIGLLWELNEMISLKHCCSTLPDPTLLLITNIL